MTAYPLAENWVTVVGLGAVAAAAAIGWIWIIDAAVRGRLAELTNIDEDGDGDEW